MVGLSVLSSTLRSNGVNNVTKPLDIALVLDTSGSMSTGMDGSRASESNPSRLDSLKQAVNGFLDSAQAYNDTVPARMQSRIGLVSYSRDSQTLSGLTNDFGSLRNAVASLRANGVTRTGRNAEQPGR